MRIDQRLESGRAVLRVIGALDARNAASLYDRLRAMAIAPNVERVVLDFSDATGVDSAGVVVCGLGRRALEGAGRSLSFENQPPEVRAAFELIPETAPPLPPPLRPVGRAERVGARSYQVWGAAKALAALVADTFASAARWVVGRERVPRGSLTEQAVRIGVDALPIVGMLSALLGLILAFESMYQLRLFGAEMYMADIVGVSMVREFGPLLTAIILAGRSGSGIAAELGTMVVRDEVAALETMGIRSVRYLVLPRLAAITVVGPCLALISMAFGIAGGFALGEWGALTRHVYWERITEMVFMIDFAIGLGKALLFSWIVGFAGVFSGLRVLGGAHSVGQATTRAVVGSIFGIILVDCLITSLTTGVGTAQ